VTSDAILKLDNELDALRQFVALLTSEQQLLLNNDTEPLLTLSETKMKVASQLMEMGASRRKALLGNSADNMETWIAKHAPNRLGGWSEIRKLAAQAQHLNSTNGELINSRLQHNQQALNVLHAASKTTASLYGPDGQANLNSSGRHLGSG